jgi:hypothetical protein
METIAHTASHVQMSQYNWEDGTTTYNVQAMDAGQRWKCAISQATEAARRRFPHSNDRIEKAYELVSHVVLHPATGTATVTSSDGQRVYTVNGVCSCPDAPTKAPEGFCKHKLAVVILRKARMLVAEWKQATAPVTVQAAALDPDAVEAVEPAVEGRMLTVHEAEVGTLDVDPADEEAVEPVPVLAAEVIPYKAPAPTVPAQFVSSIKGKPFVQFAGLLTVATQQGLLSLTERVTHVTDTYVMAEARAEFEDGRVFVGVGDSSPDNVGKEVKPHWRRLAGTRAMARALRNALNVAMVAVEELD